MNERISIQTFREAGGETIRFAPGGLFGLMQTNDGMLVLEYVGEETFEVLETVPDRDTAEARLHAIGAERYQEHVAAAEADAEAHRPLLEKYGYTLWHTGGGCVAYGRMHGDIELLVTVEDGATVDAEADEVRWSCGAYREDGSFDSAGSFTLEEALRNAPILATRFDPPTDRHYDRAAFAARLRASSGPSR